MNHHVGVVSARATRSPPGCVVDLTQNVPLVLTPSSSRSESCEKDNEPLTVDLVVGGGGSSLPEGPRTPADPGSAGPIRLSGPTRARGDAEAEPEAISTSALVREWAKELVGGGHTLPAKLAPARAGTRGGSYPPRPWIRAQGVAPEGFDGAEATRLLLGTDWDSPPQHWVTSGTGEAGALPSVAALESTDSSESLVVVDLSRDTRSRETDISKPVPFIPPCTPDKHIGSEPAPIPRQALESGPLELEAESPVTKPVPVLDQAFEGEGTEMEVKSTGPEPQPLSPPSISMDRSERTESEVQGPLNSIVRRKLIERDDGDHGTYRGRFGAWQQWFSSGEQTRPRFGPWSKRGAPTPAERPRDMVVGAGSDAIRVPGDIWHQLYDYQREGVRWLWGHFHAGTGCVLGDEMGLGKTVQVIGFVVSLWYSDVREARRGGVLVVAPATVIEHWVREFHEWGAPLRVYLLHGQGQWSGSWERLLELVVQHGGVVVTTYAQLRNQQALLCRVPWLLAVLDEGHKIRNPTTKVAQAAKRLQTPNRVILTGTPIQNKLMELWSMMDFVCPGQFGTAGAFEAGFAQPIALASQERATMYQIRAAYHRARTLKNLLRPYLLRRLRGNTALSIPGREDHVVLVEATPVQRRLYNAYLGSREFSRRHHGSEAGLIAAIHILRRICNHPQLLRVHSLRIAKRKAPQSIAQSLQVPPRRFLPSSWDVEGRGRPGPGGGGRRGGASSVGAFDFLERARGPRTGGRAACSPARRPVFRSATKQPRLCRPRSPYDSGDDGSGGDASVSGFASCYGVRLSSGRWGAPPVWARGVLVNEPFPADVRELWRTCGKFGVLKALLEEWLRTGSRALIFTQTLSALDLLEAWIRAEKWSALRIDGQTQLGRRRDYIREFNREDGPFLLLLTTRTGGLGVNLTGANRVVLFELDWNPSSDKQACARVLRIGQKAAVQIYRLVVKGSVEEEIMRYQVFKEYLSHKVLTNARHRKLLKLRSSQTLFRPLAPPNR